MRAATMLVLSALIISIGPVPARAQTLPYDPLTASCDDIVAHADDNQATKMAAASLYAHGIYMGKTCFSPDLVRAFELWSEIGDRSSMQSVLKDLQTRANSGNPRAISHLKKLKAAGYIKAVRE